MGVTICSILHKFVGSSYSNVVFAPPRNAALRRVGSMLRLAFETEPSEGLGLKTVLLGEFCSLTDGLLEDVWRCHHRTVPLEQLREAQSIAGVAKLTSLCRI